MTLKRPNEITTGIIGSLVGAVLGILAAYGVSVPEGVTAPLVTIVSWVPSLVTWYISNKQRDPAAAITAAADGTVVGG